MIVDCAVYDEGARRPGELPLAEACEASEEPGAFVWVGVVEPAPEEFDAIAREFHLHPLAVEDAVIAHQRPKLEHLRRHAAGRRSSRSATSTPTS